MLGLILVVSVTERKGNRKKEKEHTSLCAVDVCGVHVACFSLRVSHHVFCYVYVRLQTLLVHHVVPHVLHVENNSV